MNKGLVDAEEHENRWLALYRSAEGKGSEGHKERIRRLNSISEPLPMSPREGNVGLAWESMLTWHIWVNGIHVEVTNCSIFFTISSCSKSAIEQVAHQVGMEGIRLQQLAPRQKCSS